MSIPTAVLRSVEDLLGAAGGGPVHITASLPVGGGCVNTCARIETDGRAVFFLKWNAEAPAEMFEAEADGLAALRAAGTAHGLRVPEIIGVGRGAEPGSASTRPEPGWLLLEHVERGAGGRDYGRALGRELAGLHRRGVTFAPPARAQSAATQSVPAVAYPPRYGWHRDNFIGPLPQANLSRDDWALFWRDARLAPQVSLAVERGRLSRDDRQQLDRLLDHSAEALAGSDADGPSLLHGDLWSGNVYPDVLGRPVLIDPAVYVGHREVDIAMSELFGGFPPGFADAYHDTFPVDEGYRRIRRSMYQLYYLLVHVNLFGESYLEGMRGAVKKVLRAL